MGWKTLCIGLGALALLGCGDDKAPAMGAACPAGATAGEEVPCDCGDAGADGVATCQDEGTLSDCDCAGGMSGTGGTGATGGSGGTAGNSSDAGGMTGGMGATGGSGGMSSDDDGGVDPEPDAEVPMEPLPDDGNQGSVCEDGVDCNQGLDCFNTGASGQGFCSIVCTEDEDCESIAGAAYTCSTAGVCFVECTDEDDTESCPDQMECLSTVSGFMGGGGAATFRCKYPDAPPPTGTQTAFEACSADMLCEDGLECSATLGGSGYCTISCMPGGDDCGDISAPSGDLEPECTMGFGGPGGITGRCTLDCSDAPDDCPDGMACITTGMSDRCGYE